MELNDIQRAVVETEESKVVVISAASSGKTTVLAARLQHLLQKGADPSKIVCITFTNAAAKVLRERIGDYPSLFIGTIHSYCNRLLLMSGYDTSGIISEENFDELFEAIKERPWAIKPVEHLLLDEAQDTSENEFYFLIDMIQPKNYMLVGDTKQCIFGFKGASPGTLLELTQNWDVTTFDMNRNYRNGSSILAFAKEIIKKNGKQYVDTSVAMRGVEGKVYQGQYTYDDICNLILEKGHYNDWFVLCRTNGELAEMGSKMKEAGIPFDSFKRSELDANEFQEAMARDSVKLLTIHTSKGLERKYVVVVGARFYNSDERCVDYVAATRARDVLIWVDTPKKVKPKMMKW